MKTGRSLTDRRRKKVCHVSPPAVLERCTISNEQDVPEKLHATLGASSASRWIACPGSVRLSAGLPNTSSEHAIEGTRAHALAELSLTKDVDPRDWVGESLEGGVITEEMAEHVAVFTGYCASFGRDPQHVWVERRFNLAALEPPAPMFGTADFVAYTPLTKTLHVVDLKYGQGVVVEVKDNPQLRYYALGAAMSMPAGTEIDTVVVTIVQPRVSHVDGPIRTEVIDFLDLLGWTRELLDAAEATTKPDAPLHAGSHCRWCPARAQCPERAEHALAVAQQEFSVIEAPKPFTPPAPELIPEEQFFSMLQQLDVLDDWSRAMRERAEAMLQRGEEVPGFKLVARRATRKWLDETTAGAALLALGNEPEEIFEPRTIRSPAQIEKLLGKKQFAEVMAPAVIKKSSGLTMVPASDARPAVDRTDGSEFGILPAASTTPTEGRD